MQIPSGSLPQATLAIRHIVKICGPPPLGRQLEVQWQEHELGNYPTIVLLWDDAMAQGALELSRR